MIMEPSGSLASTHPWLAGQLHWKRRTPRRPIRGGSRREITSPKTNVRIQSKSTELASTFDVSSACSRCQLGGTKITALRRMPAPPTASSAISPAGPSRRPCSPAALSVAPCRRYSPPLLDPRLRQRQAACPRNTSRQSTSTHLRLRPCLLSHRRRLNLCCPASFHSTPSVHKGYVQRRASQRQSRSIRAAFALTALAMSAAPPRYWLRMSSVVISAITAGQKARLNRAHIRPNAVRLQQEKYDRARPVVLCAAPRRSACRLNTRPLGPKPCPGR